MSQRRPITLEDVIERGRMREPPRTWYPIGSRLSSSSQGETRSLSDGLSSEVGNYSMQSRGRGPSLMRASWSKSSEKIKIVLNDRGQPVMSDASSLATNLGILARDGSLLPLHYTDWRYVPAHYKRRVWEEIKAHTDADDSMEKWFMQSVGRKWQGWKHEAKAQGYTPYDNDADRIAHKPSRVTEEQWRCLVYYWNDKDVKDTSVNNQNYRSKQKLLHTSGRTPHYLVEQKEKQAGKKPTRIDIFVKTHTKKGGGDVNDQTAAIVTKLKALQDQEGSSSHAMSEDAIFTQAIGPERPGRTRGLGLGATKSKLLGANNNHQAPSQSSTENDRRHMKMKAKMQKMKRFLEALGYTDDSDDDSDEFNERPNENLPDASSAHRQASPQDIDRQPQLHSEPTLLPQSIQRADSHQCEVDMLRSGEKQVEANRNACETTRVTKKRRKSQNGSN